MRASRRIQKSERMKNQNVCERGMSYSSANNGNYAGEWLVDWMEIFESIWEWVENEI